MLRRKLTSNVLFMYIYVHCTNLTGIKSAANVSSRCCNLYCTLFSPATFDIYIPVSAFFMNLTDISKVKTGEYVKYMMFTSKYG